MVQSREADKIRGQMAVLERRVQVSLIERESTICMSMAPRITSQIII